jgi:dinuclear metal center YbgI/SA1388 family protein
LADRDEILAYASELLDLDAYPDYGPMGLQVAGAREVERLACGVSSSLELFERTAAAGAQMLLVHHGLLWDRDPRVIDDASRRRLKTLFDAEITLAAYHLALDAHPEVGNNALICEALGLERGEPFGAHRGRPVGFVGRSEDGIAFAELRSRCEAAFGQDPFAWETGPELVHSVGIVSGAAASSFGEAIALGLDAFLTGEPAEHVMADARESRTHFIAAGHYATETVGVRRLGELLAERFGLEHHFIEAPNPI